MASAEPPKKPPKKSIHEFFKPYLKSSVPAKRPSPSISEAHHPQPARRDDQPPRTPKSERRKFNDHRARTPGSSAHSPLSAPGSRASLSIRSKKHSTPPIPPPSVYRRASIFNSPSKNKTPESSILRSPSHSDATPKPQTKSFSFTDLPCSTQAVVKDGKVIEILDSDGDDTDSLESLEDLFERRKNGHSTSLSSTPGDDEAKLEADRVRTLGMFLGKARNHSAPLVGKDKIRELRAKESRFTFNIASLINEHLDDEEVENNVRRAREDVDAAIKAAQAESDSNLDKRLLAAVATTEDGEHGVARLMDAVDRTEALTSESVFLFFGANGLNDWHDEEPFEYPYPEDAIPGRLWSAGDNDARSRAYRSGYMADLARKRQVPDEALNWTFENVILERSDEIREAYIDCLRSASPSWTRTNVTAQEVQSVFQTLGAADTSIRDSVEITPRHRLLKEPRTRDPKYLLATLDVFNAICSDMDFLALSKLTSLLCRLAIDTELMSDIQVCGKVEDLLDLLLSLPDVETRSHVAERILADLGKYLKEPTLQANLLSHIPPTSPLAMKTRILLAQVFLLETSTPRDQTYLALKISLDSITNHVCVSPDFDTRRRKDVPPIDYVALRARTHILDVAISDGGKQSAYPAHADEVAFNKTVDRLADTIKSIEVAISDPGASHMSRTEAKDDLRALHARLLFSVRTEVRPKRHIFDGNRIVDAQAVKTEEKGKDFMKKFFGRRKEKDQDTGGVETQPIVTGSENVDATEKSMDSLVSSSSEQSETEKAIRRQLDLE